MTILKLNYKAIPKKLLIVLALLVNVLTSQSQSLGTFDGASRTNLSYTWTDISSVQSMQIDQTSVEFIAQKARMTREVSVQNHISKNSYTSSRGEIVKGVLQDMEGKIIGIARFSHVGTSIAGTADVGNNTYKFRPDRDGNYAWELEASFVCGTEDVDHSDLQNPSHIHGPECHHDDAISASSSGMRDPQSCITESIQDVAFVTDDLMTDYGNDLNAILAQIAISDSYAEDIMDNSGFPDVAFFQESVHVVDFPETGSTYANVQKFSDSLYANPPGIIANIAQGATTWVTILYSLGGGGAAGAATPNIYPLPAGNYYNIVLGDNGGIGTTTKIHEGGHSFWGGEHEDQVPNPVIYRRAYDDTDALWGDYVTIMGRGNFPGVRLARFSTSVAGASFYHELYEHTFTPIGSSDRDMCTRITEEWGRPGIVQTVDITPATPTISADDATTFCDGGSVELSVDTPESGVDYVWSNGITANSITVTEAGSYSCYGQASSTCTGGTSNVITVTVNPVVEITGNPSDVTVFVGNPFTLTASGNNVNDYQWTHDGTNISGATSATYSVASATTGDAGSYYCILSNGCGSENTSAAIVTVNVAFATYTPATSSVGASAGDVYSDFETNDASAVNVLTGDPGGAVSPINMGTGTTNVELSYPINLDLATKQFVITATTSPFGEVATWTVNQDGATPSMVLSPPDITVNADVTSASTDLTTQSDMTWTVDDSNLPTGWSVVPLSGTGNETFAVTLTVNTAPDPVTGSFTIDGTGAGAGTSVTFPITQLGAGTPLEAYTDSDKPDYSTGQTIQLYGNAAGGLPPYNFSWTGPGFSSSEQNPTLPAVAGEGQEYTLTVTDNNSDTETDMVVIDVYDVGFFIEVNPLTGSASTEFSYYSEVVQDPNDPRTVDFHELGFGDGNSFDGVGNILETTHIYAETGVYDVEQSYVLSDGSADSYTNVGIIDVTTTVGEESVTGDNIEIYPNPTSGKVFISTQERPEVVSIMDVTGSEVIHLKNPERMTQIDLSGFSTGLYFVRITMNGITYVKKIDKQ